MIVLISYPNLSSVIHSTRYKKQNQVSFGVNINLHPDDVCLSIHLPGFRLELGLCNDIFPKRGEKSEVFRFPFKKDDWIVILKTL
jgi:hypothetical protein